MMSLTPESHLAEILGINLDDLLCVRYEIETETLNGQIYNYRILFDQDSPKEILERIYQLADDYTVDIEPWEFNQQYDYDDQYDAITENKYFLRKFFDEIEKLTQLSQLRVDDKGLDKILKRQIFISVIGTRETFLSETFINLTNDNEEYFRNFIESHPEFRKRKFELRDIFNQHESIKETAKVIMLDTIYHNLPTVKEMFSDTFKIEFPKINIVYPLVLKRHDLVHRNGMTKQNEKIETDDKAIEELIKEVCEFVTNLAGSLNLKR